MKRWGAIFGVSAVLLVAFIAYAQAGKTRAASQELAQLIAEISKERERIEVLQSEWAYLNRPERLRYLVMLNQDALGLKQIDASNYGETSLVPYPSPDALDALPPIDNAQIEQILTNLEGEAVQ